MNFGIRAHDIESNDIETLCSKLKLYNINNIQLALRKSIQNINLIDGTFSPGLAGYFKRELIRNDINVSVLGCYINPVHPNLEIRKQEINRFKENIKFAKYIGADMVGTETGSINEDFSFNPENHQEEAYQTLLATMRELVSYAEKLGVMIGIEAVHSYVIHSPESMKRFLDDLDSPNVSVIFDPVNMLNYENYKGQKEIFYKAFELYGDRIAAVHLKDYVVKDKKLTYALPGFGEMDYKFLLELINNRKPYIAMLLEEVKEDDINRVIKKIKTI